MRRLTENVMGHGRPSFSLIAVLALLVVLLSCGTLPRESPAGMDIMARASKETRLGVPMLHLRGSSSEVGYQYGKLLAADLHNVQAEFMSLLDKVLGKGPKRWIAQSYLAGKARETLATLPPGCREELQGVAAGSGMPFDSVVLMAMTPEMLFDIGCSSIVTRDLGRLVHARNFDFSFPGNVLSKYPVVIRYEIEGKQPFVNIGFIGLFGSYTGANDAGISATEDTAIFTRKPRGACMPVGYALRLVLENAISMDEVRCLLAPVKTMGYLVTVSSVKDDSASTFELVAGGCVEDRIEGPSLRVTNRCLSPANRRQNALLIADFDVNIARENSIDRSLALPATDPVLRAKAVLSSQSYLSLDSLPPQQSLLQDAIRTVNNYTTLQSCVIDPSNRVAHVSWHDGFAPSARFMKVGLDDLSISGSFPEDGSLQSDDFVRTRAFISAMHDELMSKGFSYTKADDERLYPKDLSADLPEFAKADWTLAFALRLSDWARAEASADKLQALLPGSYYGPFWKGFTLLKLGRPGEARESLAIAAAAEELSPCAEFVVDVYRAEVEKALGNTEGHAFYRGEARGIVRSYAYSEGLASKFDTYFADPLLGNSVRAFLKD